jgi:hypothetical protein
VLSCVCFIFCLCSPQCCQYICIDHYWLSLRFSLTFINISKLMRSPLTCCFHSESLQRHRLLSTKLLSQGFLNHTISQKVFRKIDKFAVTKVSAIKIRFKFDSITLFLKASDGFVYYLISTRILRSRAIFYWSKIIHMTTTVSWRFNKLCIVLEIGAFFLRNIWRYQINKKKN